jgi:hypothetical protein
MGARSQSRKRTRKQPTTRPQPPAPPSPRGERGPKGSSQAKSTSIFESQPTPGKGDGVDFTSHRPRTNRRPARGAPRERRCLNQPSPIHHHPFSQQSPGWFWGAPEWPVLRRLLTVRHQPRHRPPPQTSPLHFLLSPLSAAGRQTPPFSRRLVNPIGRLTRGPAARAPSPAKRHGVNCTRVDAGEGWGEGPRDTPHRAVNLEVYTAASHPTITARTNFQICPTTPRPRRASRRTAQRQLAGGNAQSRSDPPRQSRPHPPRGGW